MFSKARSRAANRAIPFTLTYSDLMEMSRLSEDKCSLSGLPFDYGPNQHNSFRRPLAPSLDRINSKLGYTADNCRLVCVAVNFALSDWGQSVLFDVARGICMHQGIDDWMRGGSGDRVGLSGVVRRKHKNGSWVYNTRVRCDGVEYTVGRFPSEYLAHRRYVFVKDALKHGASIEAFTTAESKMVRSRRRNLKKNTRQTLAEFLDAQP